MERCFYVTQQQPRILQTGTESLNPCIVSKEIKVASQVKLFPVEIDNKLNFEQHINTCKSTANQLNALSRLKSFLGFQERKVLVNSFVLSNFNYCTLVWMFACSTSLTKT